MLPVSTVNNHPVWFEWVGKGRASRGALQFSSTSQPPRRGQGSKWGGGVQKGGRSTIFLRFGGIFEFPVSF